MARTSVCIAMLALVPSAALGASFQFLPIVCAYSLYQTAQGVQPTPAIQKLLNEALDAPDTKERLVLLEKAAARAKEAKDECGEGVARNLQAAIHEREKRFLDALKAYDLALQCFRACGDAKGEGRVLNNQATIYTGLGQMQKALEILPLAVAAYKRANNRDGVATAEFNVGWVHYLLGDRRQALDAYGRSLALRIEDRDLAGEATVLIHMGMAYDEIGQKPSALDAYLRVLELSRVIKDKPGEVFVLNSLGLLYNSLGNSQQALEAFSTALPLVRSIQDRLSEATVLYNLGTARYEAGQLQEALEALELSIKIRREKGDLRGMAVSLGNLGFVYGSLGQMHKELESHSESLEITRLLGDGAGEARSLINLGDFYYSMGQRQRALDLFERALELDPADILVKNIVHTRLGLLYALLGQKDKGLRHELTALETVRKMKAELSTLPRNAAEAEGRTLLTLATVYALCGDHSAAVGRFREALTAGTAVGDQRVVCMSLVNLSSSLFELGQHEEALEFGVRALVLSRDSTDRNLEAQALDSLGVLLDATSHPSLSVLARKSLLNLTQGLRRSVRSLDQRERQSTLTQNEPCHQEFAALLIESGRLPEAEQVLIMLRSEEAFAFLQRPAAARDASGQIPFVGRESGWWDKWLLAHERLGELLGEQAALIAASPSEGGEARLKDLETLVATARANAKQVVAEIEAEADSDSSKTERDAAEASSNSGGLLGVSAAFPDQAAIYAVVSHRALYLLCVSKGTRSFKRINVTSDDLHAAVSDLRAALLDPRYDPRPTGKMVYDWVVAPALAMAQGRQIVWNLDGPLQYVPLAALWDGEKYVAETIAEIRFSALSISASGQPLRPVSAEVFGSVEGTDGYGRLAFVDAEARAVATVFGTKAIVDQEFTEESLKTALLERSPDVVHLATHFRLAENMDASSLLIGRREVERKTPLHLQRELSVAEMYDWGGRIFDGVQLLVLSACNTGSALGRSGRLDAQPAGNMSAFAMSQGAQCVLASQWSVADESTAAFMREFYRLWVKEGLSKAKAVQKAQIAMLRGGLRSTGDGQQTRADRDPPARELPKYEPKAGEGPWAHPYYWAPFVLTGNWK